MLFLGLLYIAFTANLYTWPNLYAKLGRNEYERHFRHGLNQFA